MSRAVKIRELDGKQIAKKEELSVLRGTVVVFNSEQSEIAKNLKINEKGVYGMRFK